MFAKKSSHGSGMKILVGGGLVCLAAVIFHRLRRDRANSRLRRFQQIGFQDEKGTQAGSSSRDSDEPVTVFKLRSDATLSAAYARLLAKSRIVVCGNGHSATDGNDAATIKEREGFALAAVEKAFVDLFRADGTPLV